MAPPPTSTTLVIPPDDGETKSSKSSSSSSRTSNEDTDANGSFSCDLLTQSKQHIAFLKTLHQVGITIQKPSIESFRRYSALWLPFVHAIAIARKRQNPTEDGGQDLGKDLIPPPDVAWLWHCHRLAPYRYSKYMQQRFQKNEEVKENGAEDYYFLDPDVAFSVQLPEEDDGPETQNWTNVKEESCSSTRLLWSEMYPHEPFFLPSELEVEATSKKEKEDDMTMDKNKYLLGGFDVLESCERQSAFLWQVSGKSFFPSRLSAFHYYYLFIITLTFIYTSSNYTFLHSYGLLDRCNIHFTLGEKFSNDDFLNEGVDNYSKFVALMGTTNPSSSSFSKSKKNNKNKWFRRSKSSTVKGTSSNAKQTRPRFIVPTYQIDIMWHTHILSSIQSYHDDCMKLNGCILEHDDSLTDRSEGGVLDTNFKATCQLWKEKYRKEYRVKGGMYRGT